MIDFGWESQTERLKRHMSIPPKKKLELLFKINCFSKKFAIETSLRSNKRIKAARSR